jgi:hypothetical protein
MHSAGGGKRRRRWVDILARPCGTGNIGVSARRLPRGQRGSGDAAGQVTFQLSRATRQTAGRKQVSQEASGAERTVCIPACSRPHPEERRRGLSMGGGVDRKTRRQGDREDKAKRAGVDKGGRGRRGRRELDERWDGSGAGRRSKAEEKARPGLRGKASPGGKGCSYTMVTTVQVPLELELK